MSGSCRNGRGESVPRATSVPAVVSSSGDIERLTISLLNNEMPARKPVRLLGVSLSAQGRPPGRFRGARRSRTHPAGLGCRDQTIGAISDEVENISDDQERTCDTRAAILRGASYAARLAHGIRVAGGMLLFL
jgi:hypothetical protein